ncbi:hypothetical protein RQP46_009978 [Phenoliferia psychrophenolica]
MNARIEAAAGFLLQSPPGEVNDVFADVRTIIGDDAALETGILPALEQYNTEQLVVVDLNGKSVLISGASKLASSPGEEERHLDPRQGLSFLFDHMRVAASDTKPIETDPDTETIRSELDKLLEAYVSNHYNDGVCATYALPDSKYPAPEPVAAAAPAAPAAPEPEAAKDDEEESAPAPVEEGEESKGDAADEVEGEEAKMEVEEPKEDAVEEPEKADVVPEEATPAPTTVPGIKSRIFGLYLVGNKYNPSNYWTGRWRSVYSADLDAKTLTGTVKINIHYYEQGNVQLSTTHAISVPLPSDATATQIIALIKTAEQETQNKLAESYAVLSDDVFRGLRRALPKTRSKLDWGKISAYRLGTELGGGQSVEA